jgi:SAM-dependent methyltransferase
MQRKSLATRALYWGRDLRSQALFVALRRYCRGDVLDVGGWDFFLTATRQRAEFRTWTVLENDASRLLDAADERLSVVYGDGCGMEFADQSFDTVLSIQVLEHVFEPLRMVSEIARVLRSGGHAIFLIPQTSNVHLAPAFYGNFSRYWITEACARAGLEIVELEALGGFWSSCASRFGYFFMQSARARGMSDPECRRSPAFYALYPWMALYAMTSIPLCLALSLGDLSEEPNNHLVVARRPARLGFARE